MNDLFEQRLKSRLQATRLPAAPAHLRTALYELPSTHPRRRSAGPDMRLLALAAAVGLLALAGLTAVIGGGILDRGPFSDDASDLITPTSGWQTLWDLGPDFLLSPEGSGVAVTLPLEATKLAVVIACEGAGSAVASVGSSTGTVVDCSTPPGIGRTEFEVTGGEAVDALVRLDDATLVRLFVEANALPSYPSAPPLPSGIAETPYGTAGADRVAVGTLGSNAQSVIDVAGTPGRGAGDLIPIAVNGAGLSGSRLDLYSAPDGALVTTLADIGAPAFIQGSWVDATHGQVFYEVAKGLGLQSEFHRVGFDGSEDQVMASALAVTGSRQSTLALDDSAYVIESCGLPTGCERIVIDAATLASTTHASTAGEICTLIGVSDGFVVEKVGPTCGGQAVPSGDPGEPAPLAFRIVASRLDGTGERTLAEGDAIGTLVHTDDGAWLLATGDIADAAPGQDPTIELIDVATGEAVPFESDPAEGLGTSIYAQDVRLPPNWILFATDLGDLPGLQNSYRPVPLLINVLTGERIELPNLPHTIS
jgi:hypothetical protein